MAAQAAARSIEDLHRSHYEHLVGVVGRYIDRRDLAEEIVQDAFLKYHARGCSPRPGSEVAYLRSMVLNAARSALRRRLVEEKHATADATTTDSAEVQALEQIDRRELHDAIRRLPNRQRTVVTQHHLMGVPVAALATSLGISTGSVKQHGFRARASLHDRLEDRRLVPSS